MFRTEEQQDKLELDEFLKGIREEVEQEYLELITSPDYEEQIKSIRRYG